ncbi:DUF6783 domain-containing protein [Blautia wexlerae]
MQIAGMIFQTHSSTSFSK